MVNLMLAAGISMAVALLCTPLFITYLVRHSYGQFIRDDLTHHHVKRGKPTMGGAVIIGAEAEAQAQARWWWIAGGGRIGRV